MPNVFDSINSRMYRSGGLVGIDPEGDIYICPASGHNTYISSASLYLTGTVINNILPNGQNLQSKALTEATTIAASDATVTSIEIPKDAVVLAVSVRVLSSIPSATEFSVGVTGAATRYGGALSNAVDVKNPGTSDYGRYYGASTCILITPDVTPSSNAGKIRVTIHYIEVTPPTS
jgi:hypothetical protein